MASIQRRVWIDKDSKQRTSYRAQVRRKGFPPRAKVFPLKTEALDWAREVEANMRRRRYFPQHEAERHTLADLIKRQLERCLERRYCSVAL